MKLFDLVTGKAPEPQLSGNMLPNIKTCKNEWSNFSVNLRTMELKLQYSTAFTAVLNCFYSSTQLFTALLNCFYSSTQLLYNSTQLLLQQYSTALQQYPTAFTAVPNCFYSSTQLLLQQYSTVLAFFTRQNSFCFGLSFACQKLYIICNLKEHSGFNI